MSAMAEALRKAGPNIQLERAKALAIRAWQTWPRSHESGMRYNFVARALSEEMTYAMVLDDDEGPKYIRKLINLLLERWSPARKVKNTGPVPVGGGQSAVDTQKADAPATNSVPAQAGGGGQVTPDTQKSGAPANPSRDDAVPQGLRRSEPARLGATPTATAPAAPSNFGALIERKPTAAEISARKRAQLEEMERVRAERHKARMEMEYRTSPLFTVQVNGKPIGDCTVSDVRKWVEKREADGRAAWRDVRFGSWLISGLPGNVVIKNHYSPLLGEVREKYAKSEAQNAA